MTAPLTHLQESQKLTADALVDLFIIDLKNDPVTLRFKTDNTVTWLGDTYEGVACQLTGDTRTAEGEEPRPSLVVMNPFGVWNDAAIRDQLDLALVTRRRVLRAHLEGNVAIYQQHRWYVSRVRDLISGQSITFELRALTEGPNFQIPVRQYMPPEFPFVTL